MGLERAMSIFSCMGPKALNPLDPRYAVKGFVADKLEMWCDLRRDVFFLCSEALRGELKDLQGSLAVLSARQEEQKLEAWELECLQEACEVHKKHVKAEMEKDRSLEELLKQRIVLNELMEKDPKVLESWESFQVVSKEGKMLQMEQAFLKYQELLLKQLEHRETGALVLARAYFAPEELRPLLHELLEGPACLVGSLIHYASDEGFASLMRREQISRLTWYCSLKGKRNEFQESFVKRIAAMNCGLNPSSCGLCA